MPRIPDIDPATLTPEQKRIHDEIVSGPRGKVEEPLRVWLTSPGLADRAQALGAFCRYGTSLDQRLSELAILVTGAYWRAGFRMARSCADRDQGGLDAAAVDPIRVDKVRNSNEDDEKACVYAFARELLTTRRVSDETYRQWPTTLSRLAVVDLVGVLGFTTG